MNAVILNKLSKEAYTDAQAHGFFTRECSNNHHLCMVICELTEAVEAARQDKHAQAEKYSRHRNMLHVELEANTITEQEYIEQLNRLTEETIKDSVEDELADAYIRLLSLAGKLGMVFKDSKSLHAYVVYESHTITENVLAIISALTEEECKLEFRIRFAMHQIERMAEIAGTPLLKYVRMKMRYNKCREYKHGKAF